MEFSRQEYWNGLPFPSPGGSSQPRDQTQVSWIAGRFFTIWATREAPRCTRMYVIFESLPICYYRIWNRVPCRYTAGPCWLSIYYSSGYMSIANSQSFLPYSLPPCWPLVRSLSLWVCFCLVKKFICIMFFRLCIEVVSYDICLSLPNLLHLVWWSPGPLILLNMALIHSFS